HEGHEEFLETSVPLRVLRGETIAFPSAAHTFRLHHSMTRIRLVCGVILTRSSKRQPITQQIL
ncbi:MAG TPA: hypothetical protein DCE18_20060, partial [Syntrophobacteraceae bacterium]|nr:hypothetical protein [Syntrophobacteraceae bacterium]